MLARHSIIGDEGGVLSVHQPEPELLFRSLLLSLRGWVQSEQPRTSRVGLVEQPCYFVGGSGRTAVFLRGWVWSDSRVPSRVGQVEQPCVPDGYLDWKCRRV